MTIIEALVQLRNDLKLWVTNNLRTKVDKEDGKGLSSNDFTDEEKEKLATLDESLLDLELGKYNQHWWERRTNSSLYELATSQTIEKVTLTENWYNYEFIDFSFLYSDTIELDETNGMITLVSPTELIITYSGNSTVADFLSIINALKGKYFAYNGWIDLEDTEGLNEFRKYVDLENEVCRFESVYYAEPTAQTYCEYEKDDGETELPDMTIAIAEVNLYIDACAVTSNYTPDENVGTWENVWSSDRNAYKDYGIENGYEYIHLGVPFDNWENKTPKMELISYDGTGGLCCEENAVSITASFIPDVWVMFTRQANYNKILDNLMNNSYTICFTKDLSTIFNNENEKLKGYIGFGSGSNTRHAKISKDGKTLTWYTVDSDSTGGSMFNASNYTYTVLAVKF